MHLRMSILGLLLVMVATVAVAGDLATLEGRWLLVEQTYGKGQSNLIDQNTDPVSLEFTPAGTGFEGKIRAADGEQAYQWPALIPGRQPRQIDERTFSAQRDRVLVRYRFAPSESDDLILHVTEDYRVVDGGQALVGQVVVIFFRDGESRGSYRLQRRFERQP